MSKRKEMIRRSHIERVLAFTYDHMVPHKQPMDKMKLIDVTWFRLTMAKWRKNASVTLSNIGSDNGFSLPIRL